MENNYYSISPIGDMVDSVAEAAMQAQRLCDGHYSPKWLVIAAHSAAQGAMVSFLNDGNGIAAWKDKHQKEWLKVNDQRMAAIISSDGDNDTGEYSMLSEVKLHIFMKLYDVVKARAITNQDSNIGLALNAENEQWTKELNDSRNSFIHFESSQISVCNSSIVSMVRSAATIVSVLSQSTTFNSRWGDDIGEDQSSLQVHLEKLESALLTLADTDIARPRNQAVETLAKLC
jgi:hypothetical protein